MMLRLLDVFAGEGGAGYGYELAGFDVVSVDLNPMPRNRAPMFIEMDALEAIERMGHKVDAIHASPPCQAYTTLRHRTGREYDDLVDAVRDALVATGKPYVIENVPGSPLRDPLLLCGTMFGLGAMCRDGEYRQLRRHRLFESNVAISGPVETSQPRRCDHAGQTGGVYGTGGGGQMTRGYKFHPEEAQRAMEIDWMSRRGLSQAIPPAYTRHLGRQLVTYLQAAA